MAFATETVYGLGCDATNDLAVASIYAQKGRPSFNPLIIHFATLEAAKKHVEFSKNAETIAKLFWPGPLTLVLNRKPDSSVSKLCSAGGETLAVRIPRHQSARDLISSANCPVAAPSANSSGKISPTNERHVFNDFGEDFPVLKGGACEVGLESTVLDLSGTVIKILRPGSITADMIKEATGFGVEGACEAETPSHGAMKSPGQLTSHYAPKQPVRINCEKPEANEYFVAFGPSNYDHQFNLSESGDLVEAAANLFSALHEANNSAFDRISFAPIPAHGIGIAINDRLTRAAADR